MDSSTDTPLVLPLDRRLPFQNTLARWETHPETVQFNALPEAVILQGNSQIKLIRLALKKKGAAFYQDWGYY